MSYFGLCIACAEETQHNCVDCFVFIHNKCAGFVEEENLRCPSCKAKEIVTENREEGPIKPPKNVDNATSSLSSLVNVNEKKIAWRCEGDGCNKILLSEKAMAKHVENKHNHCSVNPIYTKIEIEREANSKRKKISFEATANKRKKVSNDKISTDINSKKGKKSKENKPSSYDFKKLSNFFSLPSISEEFTLKSPTKKKSMPLQSLSLISHNGSDLGAVKSTSSHDAITFSPSQSSSEDGITSISPLSILERSTSNVNKSKFSPPTVGFKSSSISPPSDNAIKCRSSIYRSEDEIKFPSMSSSAMFITPMSKSSLATTSFKSPLLTSSSPNVNNLPTSGLVSVAKSNPQIPESGNLIKNTSLVSGSTCSSMDVNKSALLTCSLVKVNLSAPIDANKSLPNTSSLVDVNNSAPPLCSSFEVNQSSQFTVTTADPLNCSSDDVNKYSPLNCSSVDINKSSPLYYSSVGVTSSEFTCSSDDGNKYSPLNSSSVDINKSSLLNYSSVGVTSSEFTCSSVDLNKSIPLNDSSVGAKSSEFTCSSVDLNKSTPLNDSSVGAKSSQFTCSSVDVNKSSKFTFTTAGVNQSCPVNSSSVSSTRITSTSSRSLAANLFSNDAQKVDQLPPFSEYNSIYEEITASCDDGILFDREEALFDFSTNENEFRNNNSFTIEESTENPAQQKLNSSVNNNSDKSDRTQPSPPKRQKFVAPLTKPPRGKCVNWKSCQKCSILKDCGECINCKNKNLRQKCLLRQCPFANKKIRSKLSHQEEENSPSLDVLGKHVTAKDSWISGSATKNNAPSHPQDCLLSSSVHSGIYPLHLESSPNVKNSQPPSKSNSSSPGLLNFNVGEGDSINILETDLVQFDVNSPATIEPLGGNSSPPSEVSQSEENSEINDSVDVLYQSSKMPKFYKCNTCGKSFSRNSYAVNHCKNTFSWTCDECGHTIKQRNNVARHKSRCKANLMKLLSVKNTDDSLENTIITCDICAKEYSTKGSFKSHMYSVHKNVEGIFKCDKCDLTYNTQKELKKHSTLNHEKNTSFHCELCDYFCFSKSGLRKHKLNVHKPKTHPVKTPINVNCIVNATETDVPSNEGETNLNVNEMNSNTDLNLQQTENSGTVSQNYNETENVLSFADF